jgi:hypothetical protein
MTNPNEEIVATDYLALSEFDNRYWRRFDNEKWQRNKIKYMQHLRSCWGRLPDHEIVDAVFIEEEQKEFYRIEKFDLKVSSSGYPLDDFVPVWILIPHDLKSKPCPTMIIHHQHAGQFHLGKEEPAGIAGDPRQAFGLELIRQGYIVVVFDALCFSERQENGGEKFTFTRLLLYGMTLNGKYCYDVSRIIDFLETQSLVDKNRIGIMGHSLGGQMAIWAAVFDPRLKVIISSCGFSRYSSPESILGHNINHNFAAYLPNFLDSSIGIDMHEVIGLLYPRPLVLSSGGMDRSFPIEGVADIHHWVEELYASENHIDNILTLRHISGHWVPPETKTKMYTFLKSHL